MSGWGPRRPAVGLAGQAEQRSRRAGPRAAPGRKRAQRRAV